MGELDDRQQITDVLVRYATGIDSKDWKLFRTCFTADAETDYGSIGGWSGADEITAWMAAAHEKYQATNHLMSNFVIDVSGDRATAVSYVHAVLALAGEDVRGLEAVGTYRDTLVRTGNGWQIEKRTAVMTRAQPYGAPVVAR
jgi:3-phenylpropionate/cinnamic acid dioxygenase small subunit